MTQTTTRPTVERQRPGRRWIAAAPVLLAVGAGVDQAAFEDFRERALPLVGAYVETTGVDLVAAQTDGYVTWRFTTRFEQEDGVEVRLTFPQDGTQISGAQILSDRLGTR